MDAARVRDALRALGGEATRVDLAEDLDVNPSETMLQALFTDDNGTKLYTTTESDSLATDLAALYFDQLDQADRHRRGGAGVLR